MIRVGFASEAAEFGEADMASSEAGGTDMADVIGAGGPFRSATDVSGAADVIGAAGEPVETDSAGEDGDAGAVVSSWGVRL